MSTEEPPTNSDLQRQINQLRDDNRSEHKQVIAKMDSILERMDKSFLRLENHEMRLTQLDGIGLSGKKSTLDNIIERLDMHDKQVLGAAIFAALTCAAVIFEVVWGHVKPV